MADPLVQISVQVINSQRVRIRSSSVTEIQILNFRGMLGEPAAVRSDKIEKGNGSNGRVKEPGRSEGGKRNVYNSRHTPARMTPSLVNDVTFISVYHKAR